MRTDLLREVVPLTTDTAARGIPRAEARTDSSSVLARPFSGAALTAILSESPWGPRIAERLAPGRADTFNTVPAPAGVTRMASTPSQLALSTPTASQIPRRRTRE